MGENNLAEYSNGGCIVEDNILPLTSTCNTRCVFCSHRFNPPEVRVYRIPPRSLSLIKNVLPFIDPTRPIIIGESVTRIIEGEPFTHPDITQILHLLRSAFPRTPVHLTTNGILLNEDTVYLLSSLGKITINLSLNCIGEVNRKLFLGDNKSGAALNSVKLLQQYGIPFHGSVVAMPHLTGWDDLEKTISFLAGHKAETVRIFEPGFSSIAPPDLQFNQKLRDDLASFIRRLRRIIDIPITLEPSFIVNLEAEVAGVINGSPAARANLKPGDVILAVNGSSVSTRVQAFERILKAKNPEVTIKRGGEQPVVSCIPKGGGERSGLVMDYDLDPGLIDDMARAVRRHRARSVLILTSQLAGPVLRQGLKRFWQEGCEVQTLEIKNRFFGGSIRSAGLLTVGDMTEDLKKILPARASAKPDLVLVPALAFDKNGYDLTATHYTRLDKDFGISVEAL